MLLTAELKTEKGEIVGLINLAPKQFKTGSRGYYANTKLELDGKRYQVQVQLVEIGSKTQTEEKE